MTVTRMTLVVNGYYDDEKSLVVSDNPDLVAEYIDAFNKLVTDEDYLAREGQDVDVLTKDHIIELENQFAEKEKKIEIEQDRKKRLKQVEEIETLKLLSSKYPDVLGKKEV